MHTEMEKACMDLQLSSLQIYNIDHVSVKHQNLWCFSKFPLIN